jgi:flagellar biosynthesis protein FliR
VTTLVLALRGGVAVAVLIALVGGIPWLVQAGLAAALGLWSALLVGAGPVTDSLLLVGAREAVIGATLGVLAAMPLVIARTAGRFVDVANRGRGDGPYGAMFGILAAAVFVGIDGHVAVIRAVVDSFVAVPALGATQVKALAALGALVPAAVLLAIPWLVTAAIIELATGAAMRVGGRAAMHAPIGAAAPAALVMITATFVSTLAVGIAALVRASL